LNPSWEDIKKYISNSGNLIYNLKKLRQDCLDNNYINNNIFASILSLSAELITDTPIAEDSPCYNFVNFIEGANKYTKFVKKVNGISEE
jgi:hypothetical protein